MKPLPFSHDSIRRYVVAEMERTMPRQPSPRVWRAIKRDAMERAADLYGVSVECVRQALKVKLVA